MGTQKVFVVLLALSGAKRMKIYKFKSVLLTKKFGQFFLFTTC